MHGVARLVARLRSVTWICSLLLAMLVCAPAHADVRAQQLEAEAWNAVQRLAWPDAQARFERALDADATRTLSWIGLGYALFWQDRFAEGLRAFERARQLDPEQPNAWAGVAHTAISLATRSYVPIDQRQALLDRAGAAYAQADALRPGMPEVIFGRMMLARYAAQPGAPPLSLSMLTALGLLFLLVAAARRIARTPRDALRADARALLSGALVPYAVTRAIVLSAFGLAPLWLERRIPFHLSPLAGNTNPILEAVAERWDSNLYAVVALAGYHREPLFEGGWSVLGQLPLLPVLYRFALQLFGDAHWSALFLSHAALLLATSAMFFAVRDTDGERVARRACWLLLLAPGSLFGSALYAEPIALAALIAAQAHARHERVATSIVSGMLAGMARLNALAIVPMLAILGLARARQGARSRWSLLVPLGPPLGLLVFMLYTHFELGDAFAYFNELREHRFANQGPAPTLHDVNLLFTAARQGKHAQILDHNAIGFLAIGCLLAYAWAGFDLLRRKRYAEASFVITGVALAIGSNLASQARYLWLLFPAYISFAQLADKPLARSLGFAVLSALLFYLASAFARFYWIV